LGTVAGSELAANRRRARSMCLAAGIVPGVVVGIILFLVVGWLAGIIALVVVTAGVAFGVWRGSTALALRSLRARTPSAAEEARLRNLTLGLCATMGLNEPDLLVVDDAVPNSCALGRDQADAVIVVTTGLLSALSLVELEGVVAHELAHVKRGDTAVTGVALTVVGRLSRMTGNDELLHRAVGPGREYRADQLAVSAVRYSPGLHDALEKLAAGQMPGTGSLFSGRDASASRWVWIDPSVNRRGGSGVGNLDDTTVRIEALNEW
jgi:Zn-dependent protease with chaperone function